MKKVKYIGHKACGVPVQYPIGCKNKTAFTHVVVVNPVAEFSDEDADAIVKLDPRNFALVEEEITEEAPKKRGPKKKVEEIA